MKNCFKCPYNGKRNNACLSCYASDSLREYGSYIPDENLIIAPEKKDEWEKPERITSMDEETEEKIRILIDKIFNDLTLNELLILKMIINGKSLTEAGKEIEAFSKSISAFSRFRAFQTRKAILKKMPEMEIALQTTQQRKRLKG